MSSKAKFFTILGFVLLLIISFYSFLNLDKAIFGADGPKKLEGLSEYERLTNEVFDYIPGNFNLSSVDHAPGGFELYNESGELVLSFDKETGRAILSGAKIDGQILKADVISKVKELDQVGRRFYNQVQKDDWILTVSKASSTENQAAAADFCLKGVQKTAQLIANEGAAQGMESEVLNLINKLEQGTNIANLTPEAWQILDDAEKAVNLATQISQGNLIAETPGIPGTLGNNSSPVCFSKKMKNIFQGNNSLLGKIREAKRLFMAQIEGLSNPNIVINPIGMSDGQIRFFWERGVLQQMEFPIKNADGTYGNKRIKLKTRGEVNKYFGKNIIKAPPLDDGFTCQLAKAPVCRPCKPGKLTKPPVSASGNGSQVCNINPDETCFILETSPKAGLVTPPVVVLDQPMVNPACKPKKSLKALCSKCLKPNLPDSLAKHKGSLLILVSIMLDSVYEGEDEFVIRSMREISNSCKPRNNIDEFLGYLGENADLIPNFLDNLCPKGDKSGESITTITNPSPEITRKILGYYEYVIQGCAPRNSQMITDFLKTKITQAVGVGSACATRETGQTIDDYLKSKGIDIDSSAPGDTDAAWEEYLNDFIASCSDLQKGIDNLDGLNAYQSLIKKYDDCMATTPRNQALCDFQLGQAKRSITQAGTGDSTTNVCLMISEGRLSGKINTLKDKAKNMHDDFTNKVCSEIAEPQCGDLGGQDKVDCEFSRAVKCFGLESEMLEGVDGCPVLASYKFNNLDNLDQGRLSGLLGCRR